MTPEETAEFLFYVKARMEKFQVSDLMADEWHDILGRFYSREDFNRAWKRHLSAFHNAPTIASFRECLESVCGKKQIPLELQPPKPKIVDSRPESLIKLEFCMDMLGPQRVTAELKAMLGGPKQVRWSEVIGMKGLRKKYLAKLEELYQEACFKSGNVEQQEIF